MTQAQKMDRHSNVNLRIPKRNGCVYLYFCHLLPFIVVFCVCVFIFAFLYLLPFQHVQTLGSQEPRGHVVEHVPTLHVATKEQWCFVDDDDCKNYLHLLLRPEMSIPYSTRCNIHLRCILQNIFCPEFEISQYLGWIKFPWWTSEDGQTWMILNHFLVTFASCRPGQKPLWIRI